MKKEIQLRDWDRILFGEGPPAYLLEVIVRVFIVYLIIFISIRFMGKRMIAEMGRADLVARVSLAAAVGLAIQRPGRGMLVSAAIVAVIVLVGRLLARLVYKNQGFEKSFQGVYAPLVKDGVLNKERMGKVQITKERLFAALREENIRHLGQVQRLYMEADGKFSLVAQKQPQPGLSVVPDWDPELVARQKHSDLIVCSSCGSPWEHLSRACKNCRGHQHQAAICLSTD